MFNLADEESWEQGVLEPLSSSSQLGAYKHSGFWKPMDTLRDKRELESLITMHKQPWLEVKNVKANNAGR